MITHAPSNALTGPGSVPPMSLRERAALDENDADNAARLLSECGRDLVYIINRGWAVWDGCRFTLTGGELAAFGVAARLRDLVETEAVFLRENAEVSEWEAIAFMEKTSGWAACSSLSRSEGLSLPDAAKRLIRAKRSATRAKYASSCGNVERINKALDYARHQSSATIDQADADPWVFVVANGEIDLRAAGEWVADLGAFDPNARAALLRPITRENLPTRAAPLAYDPGARCPEWEKFVEIAMPDPEGRRALQRCMGYLLFGANPEAACMVLRGGGGNGKSTLLHGINRVFGVLDGYAETCDIDLFMVTPGKATGGHDADLMDMIGGRVYIATEPAPTDTFSMKKIKSITGGDQKKSRGAYEKQGVKWVPRGVPVLSCNKTPRIADDDPGTRRRLIFIPLEVDFKALPKEARKSEQQVLAEIDREAAGILNWLVDGWRDYCQRGGLDIPEVWRDLRDTLMQDADPVGQFMAECTETAPEGRLRRSDFNSVYRQWAEDEGGANWSGRAINSSMREKGFNTTRIQGNEHWAGLRWQGDKADLVERVTGRRPQTPGWSPPEIDPF